MKERGQGRPEGAPKEEDRAPQKEQGTGQKESKERQPLPSVWEVLESRVRLHEELSAGRITGEEYERERIKLNRLSNKLYEKRTARDKLILRLRSDITAEPTGTLPVPLTFREPSLEEFQQFRSRVEPMPDKQIRKEIRKAERKLDRKDDEITKKKGGWPPPGLAKP